MCRNPRGHASATRIILGLYRTARNGDECTFDINSAVAATEELSHVASRRVVGMTGRSNGRCFRSRIDSAHERAEPKPARVRGVRRTGTNRRLLRRNDALRKIRFKMRAHSMFLLARSRTRLSLSAVRHIDSPFKNGLTV